MNLSLDDFPVGRHQMQARLDGSHAHTCHRSCKPHRTAKRDQWCPACGTWTCACNATPIHLRRAVYPIGGP